MAYDNLGATLPAGGSIRTSPCYDLIDELFGTTSKKPVQEIGYLEKTVSADTPIADFNEAYETNLDPQGCKTFAELIEKILGRPPHPTDSIQLDAIELLVKETSLFKAKLYLDFPIVLGTVPLPIWTSWVGLIAALLLTFWMFLCAKRN